MAKRSFPLINRDGWPFIGVFLGGGVLFLVLGIWFSKIVGATLIFFGLFSVAFFRDGERNIPEKDAVISPADGTVTEIAQINGEGYGQGQVIRIFLSVFNGHVQRAPVAGKVKELRYRPGKFLDARNPKAAFENESNMIQLETAHGLVGIKQVSGLIARRIVCWLEEGESLAKGERMGLIRYGSQVDLYLPSDVKVLAQPGQKVSAGETILAEWS